MASIAEHLDGLIVKPGACFEALSIFPVSLISLPAAQNETESISIEEGLRTGAVKVLETGDMAKVKIINKSASEAMVIDGETVTGGAQNRLINSSMLIPAGREAEIPSSCVEIKRWDCPRGAKKEIPPDKLDFTGASFSFGSLRRVVGEAKIRSLATEGRMEVDQKLVWETIVRNFSITGASTRTLDLHDLFEALDGPVSSISARFAALRGQIGLIAFQDKDTWMADIFHSVDSFLGYFRKIVRGHAYDTAVRAESGGPTRKQPTIDDARHVFKSLKTVFTHKFSMGDNAEILFFSSGKIRGTAAVHAGRLIHLNAFSRVESRPNAPGIISNDARI